MAPTAAMLLLSHNGRTHSQPPPSPSLPPPSSTTFSGFKGSALKWVLKYNLIPKAGSHDNEVQTVDPSSAADKRFEVLELCSC